ncbi:MAG: hypothetical protein LUE29_11635 [Lachnospiraceae bacterium]|nr:hypothetical protein [Lachnospiraceae bacterium]
MDRKTRRFEFEGVILDVPLRYDEVFDIYIEDYPDFTETPVWTADGYPVMFCAEDACALAQTEEAGRCVDCGSCIYYRQEPDSLIGVCRNKGKRRIRADSGSSEIIFEKNENKKGAIRL